MQATLAELLSAIFIITIVAAVSIEGPFRRLPLIPAVSSDLSIRLRSLVVPVACLASPLSASSEPPPHASGSWSLRLLSFFPLPYHKYPCGSYRHSGPCYLQCQAYLRASPPAARPHLSLVSRRPAAIAISYFIVIIT